MDREEAVKKATAEFAKKGAVIEEGSENNGVFLFFCREGDSFDPTQEAIVVDDAGARYEPCSPGSRFFKTMLDSERFM